MSSNVTLSELRSAPVSNHLGENPVWSSAEQCLYWINCEKEAELHRWCPSTGELQKWSMPERVGGIALKQGGGTLVVLATGIYDFDCASGSLKLRAGSPLPTHVKLHECTTDRQGRLWVGAYDHSFSPSNRNPAGGAYFRLDGNKLTPVIDKVNVANGLAFSPDGKTLYAADSGTKKIHAYDLDPATGTVSGKRLFLEVPSGIGFLDGATVDADGGYWLALMYGNKLHRYLPDGSLDYVLTLPFSSPTKAVFGGENLDTLFIATTKMQLGSDTPPGFELNGPMYSLKTRFQGIEDTHLSD